MNSSKNVRFQYFMITVHNLKLIKGSTASDIMAYFILSSAVASS